MNPTSDETRRALTWALHRRRDLPAALAMLPGHLDDERVVEAAAAFTAAPRAPYREVIAVLEMLGPSTFAVARRALLDALTHRLIKVRRAAAMALGKGAGALPWEMIVGRLGLENAHLVRVALVDLLATAPAPWHEEVLRSLNDPHWRVRKQVMIALDTWEAEGRPVSLELERRGLDSDRARGVDAYQTLYRNPEQSVEACTPPHRGDSHSPPLQTRPWWHEEPSLLRARLAAMGRAELRDEQAWLVWLLTHPDARLRDPLLERLHAVLDARGLRSFLILSTERRRPALDVVQEKLLRRLYEDTTEACAWSILEDVHEGRPLLEATGLPALDYDPAPVLRWAAGWLACHVRPVLELTSRALWRATLQSLRASDAPRDRAAALRAYLMTGVFEDARVEDALQDADPEVVLAALHPGLSDEVLSSLLTTHADHEALREAVAQILGSAHEVTLTTLCADPSARVRAHAARAILRARATDTASEARAHSVRAAASGASQAVREASRAMLDALERERLGPAWADALGMLREDPSAHVRAAVMTPERADELLDDPTRESSWMVLEAAAELRTKRLDAHVPTSWTRALSAPPEPTPTSHAVTWPASGPPPSVGAWWAPVRLGSTSLEVSKMGISGHYALPERGFAEAVERGVRSYFWEPIYLSQTRFFRDLDPGTKAGLTMTAGTFEGTADGLRRDLDRALRSMRLEQVQLFIVYWVRDQDRLSEELLREMERCERLGLVGAFGVSTHDRGLARELITQWPVVMVRHNAAHRGVERELFPEVEPAHTGLITFSNLCYGRMVSELPGWTHGVPSATDAYRYSLSHPAVTSCWSAPSTVAQLRENLEALTRGPMTPEELEHMRAYGDRLYRLNTGFNRFVRLR